MILYNQLSVADIFRLATDAVSFKNRKCKFSRYYADLIVLFYLVFLI